MGEHEKGNYSVWKMPHLSFTCIFSVVTHDWCVCNCNTWAHLVSIWRHSQNSTCQFLFHHPTTWMTDPVSPMWSHTSSTWLLLLSRCLFLIYSLINLFWWKGPLVLWSQMASGLHIGPIQSCPKTWECCFVIFAHLVCTCILCLLSF